jgi:SAM-dependent methyltransferase
MKSGQKMSHSPSYIESHKKKDKGKSYDAHYREIAHRKFLWEREQRALISILDTFLKGCEIHLLDFGCGTGRVTSFLESRVKQAVGVDVSDEMLSEARKKLTRTELIKADIISENALQGRKFNLITAFRFFLNAEPELRNAAMQALIPLLENNGFLVFNNHRNITSPLMKFKYKCSKGDLNFMTMQEMHDLAGRNGLEIVRIYPVGFFPLLNNKMPQIFNHIIDDIAISFSSLRNYSESPIAVCKSVL